MHANKLLIGFKKQPRTILRDRDQDHKIPLSRPRPRSPELHLWLCVPTPL